MKLTKHIFSNPEDLLLRLLTPNNIKLSKPSLVYNYNIDHSEHILSAEQKKKKMMLLDDLRKQNQFYISNVPEKKKTHLQNTNSQQGAHHPIKFP